MFYLIDKPLGITSYDVIRRLKKILQTTRIWHAGTLDPLATGLLLIATHNSTKLLPLLEWTEKRYIFTVNLTGITASLDLGTEIIPYDTSIMRARTQEELIGYLLSQTEQVPPRYSALHIDGERAYDLARDGVDFEIEPRPIHVQDVEILEFSPPTTITIALTITSGGYIRSFAPVIWEFFWLTGSGYVTALRRIELKKNNTILTLKDSIELDDFNPENTIPLTRLFPDIREIAIWEDIYRELLYGRVIPGIPEILPIIGQKYFFNYIDFFKSLMEYQDDGFHIIRNDI